MTTSGMGSVVSQDAGMKQSPILTLISDLESRAETLHNMADGTIVALEAILEVPYGAEPSEVPQPQMIGSAVLMRLTAVNEKLERLGRKIDHIRSNTQV